MRNVHCGSFLLFFLRRALSFAPRALAWSEEEEEEDFIQKPTQEREGKAEGLIMHRACGSQIICTVAIAVRLQPE